MKRFLYLRDPLFLVCCSLYAVNRWLLKPHFHSAFLHDHFDDLLLMPCALPPLLWLQRRLRLRTDDEAPTFGEISLYLFVWSILFELVGPHLVRRATGDMWDVVAYAVGGLFAGLWWQRGRLLDGRNAHEF